MISVSVDAPVERYSIEVYDDRVEVYRVEDGFGGDENLTRLYGSDVDDLASRLSGGCGCCG